MKRLIIAITGASGALYGVRALQALAKVPDLETHLILTPSGQRTLTTETDWTAEALKDLADVVHSPKDIGASIASGSFRAEGMLVVPCSIKTLSGIANSYADTLAVRAADVCLKERRRLVLMVRETPLHEGHLELMLKVTRMGAVVMPPVPAFYQRPDSVEALVDQTVGRALDLFGIDTDLVMRWQGG